MILPATVAPDESRPSKKYNTPVHTEEKKKKEKRKTVRGITGYTLKHR